MGAIGRCSDFARDDQQSPVGTAGHYDGFLLIQWPTPWPRDAADLDSIADVMAAASARRIRVQLVQPVSHPDNPATVVLYERPAGDWFAGYQGSGATTSGDVVKLAAQVLDGSICTTAVGYNDVLVCAHGARDVCCGAAGTKLATSFGAVQAESSTTRVWRTSHLGGHRFAPTALILPRGVMWAYLDQSVLQGLIDDDEALLPSAHRYYRGCSGLSGPEAQVLESACLRDVGWAVLDRPRRAFISESRWYIEIAGVGRRPIERWTGDISSGREVTVLACRNDDRADDKRHQELRLDAFTRGA